MTGVFRYETLLIPDKSNGKQHHTVVSTFPVAKGDTVKIGKTWWRVHMAVEADTNRPHLGDKIATTSKNKRS
jgi:hypothetical protein